VNTKTYGLLSDVHICSLSERTGLTNHEKTTQTTRTGGWGCEGGGWAGYTWMFCLSALSL